MAEAPKGFYTDKQGRVRPIRSKGNSAVAGTAVAIVVSALAGGGAGGAAAVSGAAEELGAGTRIFRSQEADEFSGLGKTSRGGRTVRIRGSDDSLSVTFRLRGLGHYPTTLNAESDTVCDRYADGEAQRYLIEHRCVSIHRTLIEIRERNYTARFATATIEMPDYRSAGDLCALLIKDDGGDITPLSPKDRRHRHIPFVSGSSHTTWHDNVVINTRVQGDGRTPSAALLASLATNVLFSLDK